MAIDLPPAPPPPPTHTRSRRTFWRFLVLALMLCGLIVGGMAYSAVRVHWAQEQPISPPIAGKAGMMLAMTPDRGRGLGGPPPQGRDGTRTERPRDDHIELAIAPQTSLTSEARRPGLPFVAKIPACLAVSLDPRTGRVLAAARDGRLRWFDPKTWEMLGFCVLPRPAYYLAIDSQRRRLLAATSTPANLKIGPLGDREYANGYLEEFDLDALYEKRTEPLHQIELDVQLTGLVLGSKGKYLYYLAESKTDTHLGRIDTEKWIRDRTQTIRSSGGPTALVANQDQSRLYVLGGARVVVVDPQRWEPVDTILLSSTCNSILVDSKDHLYALERKAGVHLHVLDLQARKNLARWQLDVEGQPTLALLPNSDQIVIGTSAVTSGTIWIVDRSDDPTRPRIRNEVHSSRERLLRGPILVTEDGRFLISASGQVYRMNS